MSFLASALLRPRADLRRRLDAWSKVAIERLNGTGAETYASVSSDVLGRGGLPGHRLSLVARGTKLDEARARISLTCDAEHVEVAVEVQPPAIPTVRSILSDPERSLELLGDLDALPDQFTIGAAESHGPWPRGCSEEIRYVLDRVEEGGRPLWLGWSVPRELAIEHAESLDEQMQDALVALGPLFAFLDLDARRPEVEVHRPPAARSRPAHKDWRRPDDDGKAKRRSRGHDRRPDREQEAIEPEAEPEMERETPVRAGRNPTRPAGLGGSRRLSLEPRIDPRAPVDRGTLVRVLDGPFRGKAGVVQELDGKGGARVLLGLLAVRLAVKDVAACAKGRERPLLSSSHRRPLPARS